MGYRSDVHIVVYGDKDDMFRWEGLVQSNLMHFDLSSDGLLAREPKSLFKYWEDYWPGCIRRMDLATTPPCRALYFHAGDIKWYDDLGSVKGWATAMLDAAEIGLNVEFARVGEDIDDVELTNDGPGVMHFLGLTTTIETDTRLNESKVHEYV